MSGANWFIFGAGFSGLETGRLLAAQGTPAAGTTRSADKFPKLKRAGLEPFVLDGQTLDVTVLQRLGEATHLLMSIGPDEGGDPLVPAHTELLRRHAPNLQWIGYLSTVGVYGDHEGAWVDETTECKPVSRRSCDRLEAEKAWSVFAQVLGVPLAVMRLSGIYGPGRNTFCNLADETAKRIIKPGQVFNRIHVSDIARAALHLGESRIGGLFNVTDNEPAPPQDVVTFAAGLMGIAPPPEITYDAANMSPMARSFYGEVKRVSNAKIRETGFAFQFPDYRAALTDMWQKDSWRNA
jgi:nucleoside-diphosphate-sugar epimerase